MCTNEISIYRFPEKIKKLFQKYYPEVSPITYGNLLSYIEDIFASTNPYVNEEDPIPERGGVNG